MEAQLKTGVLDVDGLSVLINCLDDLLGDIYVLGGATDFQMFLHLLRLKDLTFYQTALVVRDYDPHFITCQLTWSHHRLKVFIFDGKPDNPVNVEKWVNLISDVYPDFQLYFNQETLLRDYHSSKIFALNAARRLTHPVFLYDSLDLVAVPLLGYGFPVFLIPKFNLPSYLMRDTQSLSQIDRYLGHQRNFPTSDKTVEHIIPAAEELTSLSQHIRKHTERLVIGVIVDQPLNRSLAHSLKKYQQKFIERGDVTSHRILERLAVKLIYGYDIRQTMSFYPIIVRSHQSRFHVSVPFCRNFPCPTLAPYAESQLTIFHRKHRELPERALRAWDDYSFYLASVNKANEFWPDFAKFNLTVRLDNFRRRLTIIGQLNNLGAWTEEEINHLSHSPRQMIDQGCGQILSCLIVLLAIRNSLLDFI